MSSTPTSGPKAKAVSYSSPPRSVAILGPVDDGEVVLVDVRDAAAGDGAGEAGLVGDRIGVAVGLGGAHGPGVDVGDAVELDLAEVAGRQAAELLHHVHHRVGAELGQRLAAGIVPQRLLGPAHHLHEPPGVIDPHPGGAVGGDRLQVLRAHHRAHPGASRGPVQIVDDAGVAHAALAGDADGRHLEQRVLVPGLDPVLGLPDAPAPDLVRRPELDLVVEDVQIDRFRRASVNDNKVVAGELEFRSELAAGVGAGDGASQRPLGDHHVAAAGGGHGAGQRPGGEDQHVVRTHRVGLGVHGLPQILGAQPALAQIPERPVHVQRLDRRLVPRQIDPEYLSLPCHRR